MAPLPSYILITPARDEAQFIGLVISSVVSQTVRPMKWVIVSDGSTDETDSIVSRYAAEHSWIELVRIPERRERHFAGKAHAFRAGYARVKHLPYDIIVNLDADISFACDYMATLLGKFAENPKLGVAGSAYKLGLKTNCDYRFGPEDVPGACQLFRRQCFEDIGGYVPVKGGNLDSIAVLTARMKGWQTRTFTDRIYLHHRESGTAQSGVLAARFRKGVKAYSMGNHPLWEIFRFPYQMARRPFVVGGVALFSGYLCSLLRGAERPISTELVAFHQREQMQRLKRILTGKWLFSGQVPAQGKSLRESDNPEGEPNPSA